MSGVRAFSRIDKDGRLIIPKPIQKETGLKEGRLVEIRVQGSASSKLAVIKPFRQGLSIPKAKLRKGRC